MKSVASLFTITSSYVLCYLNMNALAQAQIVPDDSMPTPTKVEQLGKIWNITQGTKAGINLFHSFAEFSVRNGDTARFINNNPNIQNVISRMTGTSASEIFGRLKAGGAEPKFNLFLLNPNGIVFGPNASLSLNGSFVATTANAIQFGDRGSFSASSPSNPSLLRVQPSAFLFNQVRPGSILYQANSQTTTGLEVPNDRSLVLLGGNVTVDGGIENVIENIPTILERTILAAPNGRIELGGLADTGTVALNTSDNDLSLSFSDSAVRADVLLANGVRVDVTDKGSGSITINAKNIRISGLSFLFAGISADRQFTSTELGNISLHATESVNLNFSAVANRTRPGTDTVGDSGNVFITAKSLSLVDGAEVTTISEGQGSSGNIIFDIQDQITLSGISEAGSVSFIGSGVGVLNPEATGRSGEIVITAGSLSLSDGATIQSSALKEGNAGNIFIKVDGLVSLENTMFPEFNSEIRTVVEEGAIGNGGDIDIQAQSLSLTGGTRLNSSVLSGGEGEGGNISIDLSDSMNISGVGIDGESSGIFAQSEGTGAAGNVTVNTQQLRVQEGAQISVSGSPGQAGSITVNASSLFLNQGSITAETGESGAGEGANIDLNISDLLRIENESLISATANGSANGGNININTPLLTVFPPTGPNGSDITANASQGNGGRIEISAQGIFGIEERKAMEGNQTNDIDASSEFGLEGEVRIVPPEIDPSQGLVELSETVVDPSAQIAQNPCQQGDESEFVVTGRGGLPSNPSDVLSREATGVGLVEAAPMSREVAAAEERESSAPSVTQTIKPAQGWVFNDKGEVVLTAHNPNSPQRLLGNGGCSVR